MKTFLQQVIWGLVATMPGDLIENAILARKLYKRTGNFRLIMELAPSKCPDCDTLHFSEIPSSVNVVK